MMQLTRDSEADTNTPEYITEVLIDTGRFVFDIAVALAQGVLDIVGVGGSPEALIGVVLLVAFLRLAV